MDQPGNITAFVGATDMRQPTTTGEAIAVARVEPHPQYQEAGDPEYRFDVAVLTLASRSTMPPVALASPEGPSDKALFEAGQYGIALGFGLTNPVRNTSWNYLKEARLRFWSNERARDFFNGIFDDKFHGLYQIAAGGDGDASTCFGDSGGPLLVNSDAGLRLVGVTSWAEKQYFERQCDPDEPSVFTRIAGRAMLAWVKSKFRETPLVGDFDGDGRDDIATLTHGSRVSAYVSRSTGSRFGDSRLWHSNIGHDGTIARVGDFDADGRDDLWVFDASHVWILRSLGDRFADNAYSRSLVRSDGTGRWGFPVVGNFDGDGLNGRGTDDVVLLSGGDFHQIGRAHV
jgi:hypothetical protein